MTSPRRNYAIVTASYWGFTLVDGALRMLVLFHFFKLGYSPFTLALLFLLYEIAGIFANMSGGWLATRFGIPRMLSVGQLLQIIGLIMLSALNPAWAVLLSVVWVVVAQGIAGIAKDLTKTASKSAIKAVTTEGDNTQLFRLVAWFTGSKNAMKGLGFFVGGLLLDALGFRIALWLMAGFLACILVAGLLMLPKELGKAKPSSSFREFAGKSRGVNILSVARVFLFGARDVWFVVGLPVFLYSFGWTFWQVGGFLAAWTVGYGYIQAMTPRIVSRSADGLATEVPAAQWWSLALVVITTVLALSLLKTGLPRSDLVVVGGLMFFGLAFAVSSSLHSYLILAYAGLSKAAEDVGFYYAANATGRLLGTLFSGLLYQIGGLSACLAGSAVMLILCWCCTLFLPKQSNQTVNRPV